jgi:hypothetical protein
VQLVDQAQITSKLNLATESCCFFLTKKSVTGVVTQMKIGEVHVYCHFDLKLELRATNI